MFFGINVWSTIYFVGAPCYLIPFFSNVCVHLEQGRRGSRFPFIMGELYKGMLPYEHVPQAIEELEQIEQELKRLPVCCYVYDFLEPGQPKPAGMKTAASAQTVYAALTSVDGDELVPKLRRAFADALYFKENVWLGDSVTGGDTTKRPYSEDDLAHFVFIRHKSGLVLDRYFGTKKQVVVPAYKDGLPVIAIGEKAFSYNQAVEEVILPQSVTDLGVESFYSCSKLKHISFGSRVETIEKKAFCSCFDLLQIELPKALRVIKEQVFAACFNLEEVTVPEGVVAIEAEAFCDCRKLSAITLPASVAEISTLAFKKTKKHLTICTVSGSVAAKYAKKYKIAVLLQNEAQ